MWYYFTEKYNPTDTEMGGGWKTKCGQKGWRPHRKECIKKLIVLRIKHSWSLGLQWCLHWDIINCCFVEQSVERRRKRKFIVLIFPVMLVCFLSVGSLMIVRPCFPSCVIKAVSLAKSIDFLQVQKWWEEPITWRFSLSVWCLSLSLWVLNCCASEFSEVTHKWSPITCCINLWNSGNMVQDSGIIVAILKIAVLGVRREVKQVGKTAALRESRETHKICLIHAT